MARSSKISRRTRPVPGSYAELDTDEDSDEPYSAEEEVMSRKRARKRRNSATAGPAIRNQRNVSDGENTVHKSRKTIRRENLITRQSRARLNTQPVVSDGIKPDWTSLAYEILLSIFRYASTSLKKDYFQPRESGTWLACLARTHRTFTDPALTLLYEDPPISSPADAHALLQLALDPNSTVRRNGYNVKRLELVAMRSLYYTARGGLGTVDLCALLRQLPRLKALNIVDPTDKPPFRDPNSRNMRWHYPLNLFESLLASGAKLEDWRWRGDMQPDFSAVPELLGWISSAHTSETFSTLKRLALSHVVLGESMEFERMFEPLSRLADVELETIPNLSFNFLKHLPVSLLRLEITNCDGLTSGAMEQFLTSHGRNLKQLILNHNQQLSLSFFSNLGQSCPRLVKLQMDLTYFSPYQLVADIQPGFSSLIQDDERPTWPLTLQELKLLHLRNWSLTAAENFFRSLIDQADGLRDLRHLTIKAIINISWRDRAAVRDTWERKIRNKFLRKATPPKPFLVSKRAFREHNGNYKPLASAPVGNSSRNGLDGSLHVDPANPDLASPRKSNRISQRQSELMLREQQKLKQLQHDFLSDLIDDSEDAGPCDENALCDVVDIMIDNARPSETRFNEEDFMDSEASGDEEWVERGRRDSG